MAAPSKKNKLLPQLVEMNQAGMTVADACQQLGVHPVTASKWFREEGISPRQVRTGRPRERVVYTCKREGCGQAFEDVASKQRRFCSLECANLWQQETRTAFKTCSCGKRIELSEGATTMYTYRKYCSSECRVKYGKKKQANPENYVTFDCLNCGVEVTRYKNYGNGHNKYCSNTCAQKHTKVKKHIVVEDATVLDSLWEGLFWCLCGFAKIPVERFDREQGVEWREGCWYAPDFWLPVLGIAIEVKGREDEDDATRWNKFGRPLVVVGREELDMLRKADDVARAIQGLVQSGDGS